MQRAHASSAQLPASTRAIENTICPTNAAGRTTHKHVLWTNAFFDWMEERGLALPTELNPGVVRVFANCHHRPDGLADAAMGWLSAKADRYSSGMDRKPHQEAEDTGEPKAWDEFRRTPLQCIFDDVRIGLGAPAARHWHALREFDPEDAEALMPVEVSPASSMPAAYADLWKAFSADFEKLCRAGLPLRLFEECLLGLLERYTWAIPSSTIDIPDVSLYDHSRTVAAIAACLQRWHAQQGTLGDEKAVRDDAAPKFRFIAGDLSGIQATLFRLERQGVSGVNRVLRARSFLLGMICDAAAIALLRALDLPASCLLQQAGGRFLVLVPNVPAVDETVSRLRNDCDRWLVARYTGSLALNLATGPAFSGADFTPGRYQNVQAALGAAIDDAKSRPLASVVSDAILKLDYAHGACRCCGVQPAAKRDDYCDACDDERTLGRALTRAHFVAVGGTPIPGAMVQLPMIGLCLSLVDAPPATSDLRDVLSFRGHARRARAAAVPWSVKWHANHVPVWRDDQEHHEPVYAGFSEDDEALGAGQQKTFARISALGRESVGDGWAGRPFLAVLKADVDRLGIIFADGLRRAGDVSSDRNTVSRFAQLSRMTDAYFSAWLPGLLRREFPETYSVYSGGDDVLLVGPWRQMLQLAARIEESFQRFTGNNPNITLSAGVELIHANYPVNRAVEAADARLDRAKQEGRNRVCAITSEPLDWKLFRATLDEAEWIVGQMRTEKAPLPTAFAYRLLVFADQANRARTDPKAAGWRAKLAYHLARNVKDDRAREGWVSRLGFGSDLTGEGALARWRLPLSIAIYRNRS